MPRYLSTILFFFWLTGLAAATPVVFTLETQPTGAEVYLLTSSTKNKGLYLGRSDQPIAIEERYLKGRASLDLRLELADHHPVTHNLKVLAITEGAKLPSNGPIHLPLKSQPGLTYGPIAIVGLFLSVAVFLGRRRSGAVVVEPESIEISDSMDPLIGKKICSYKIEKAVDKGGMGTVYRASSKGQDRKLAAIKVIDLAGRSEELKKRFFRELAVASKLHHPAIVQTWDYELVEDRFLAIAMEFLDGAPLSRTVIPGSIKPQALLDIIRPVFDGLDYMHSKGIAHRDIKPQNIFVLKDKSCKIIDFGLARDDHQEALTQPGMLVGTPRYMAPEQISKACPVDQQADQYALGLIIFEFVVGRAPFLTEDPRELLLAHISCDPSMAHEVNESIPDSFSQALAKMYARDPRDRYESVKAALLALEKSLL